MLELDPEVLKKAGLAKQSQTDWVQTLSKPRIRRKRYSISKIDGNRVVVGNVCLTANSASERFGQIKDIELEQNG